MPQSVGCGEAEILRVGIRPVEACPPSDWPSLPNKCRTGLGHFQSKSDAAPLPVCGPVLLHELTFSFVLNTALGSPASVTAGCHFCAALHVSRRDQHNGNGARFVV
jgi:hypothetical protein